MGVSSRLNTPHGLSPPSSIRYSSNRLSSRTVPSWALWSAKSGHSLVLTSTCIPILHTVCLTLWHPFHNTDPFHKTDPFRHRIGNDGHHFSFRRWLPASPPSVSHCPLSLSTTSTTRNRRWLLYTATKHCRPSSPSRTTSFVAPAAVTCAVIEHSYSDTWHRVAAKDHCKHNHSVRNNEVSGMTRCTPSTRWPIRPEAGQPSPISSTISSHRLRRLRHLIVTAYVTRPTWVEPRPWAMMWMALVGLLTWTSQHPSDRVGSRPVPPSWKETRKPRRRRRSNWTAATKAPSCSAWKIVWRTTSAGPKTSKAAATATVPDSSPTKSTYSGPGKQSPTMHSIKPAAMPSDPEL